MSRTALRVIAILLAAYAQAPALAQLPTATMAGDWEGTARITVNWTLRRELDVRVAIREDGSVSGMVGDAQLRDGRMLPNRSRVARAMGLGTDYVIRGRLAGSIIHAETIERDAVRLTLNWTGSTLEGELVTSGSHELRRDDMVLTASGLVLRRAAAALPIPRRS